MPPVTRKRLKEVEDGDSKDSGDAIEGKKMEANVESPVKGEESIKVRTRRQSLLTHRGKENLTTPLKGDVREPDTEGKSNSRSRLATPQKKVHNSGLRNSTISLVKAMSDCELSPAKRKLRRYSMLCVDEKNEDSDTEDEIPLKKLSSCKDLCKETDGISSKIHSGIDDRNLSQCSIAKDEGSGKSSEGVETVSRKECSSEKSVLDSSTQSPISDKKNENLKQLERTPEPLERTPEPLERTPEPRNVSNVHVLDTSLVQGRSVDDMNANAQSESDKAQVGNERVSVTNKTVNMISVDDKADEDNNEDTCNIRLINPPHGKITSNEINTNSQILSVAEQIQDEKFINATYVLDSNRVEGETVEVNNIDKIHTSDIDQPHCKIVKNETCVNGQIESVTKQSPDKKLVNTLVLSTGNAKEEIQCKVFEHKNNTQSNTSVIIPQHSELVVEGTHGKGVDIELGQEQVQDEKSAMTASNLIPESIEADAVNDMEMIDTAHITERKDNVECERDDDHDIYDPNFKLRIESSPELNMQEDDLTKEGENENVIVYPNTEMSIAVMSSNKGCVVEERLDLISEDKDDIGRDEGNHLGKLQQEECSDDSGVEASLPPCGQICAENNCSGIQIDTDSRDNFEKTSLGKSDICDGNHEPDSKLEILYPPSAQLAVQNIDVGDHQSVKNNVYLESCKKAGNEDSYGDISCTGNSDFENIGDKGKSNLEGDKNIKDLISLEEKVKNGDFDVSVRSDNETAHCDDSVRNNDSKRSKVDTNSNSDIKSVVEKCDNSKAKCNGIFRDEISEVEGLDKGDASSEEGSARFSDEISEEEGLDKSDATSEKVSARFSDENSEEGVKDKSNATSESSPLFSDENSEEEVEDKSDATSEKVSARFSDENSEEEVKDKSNATSESSPLFSDENNEEEVEDKSDATSESSPLFSDENSEEEVEDQSDATSESSAKLSDDDDVNEDDEEDYCLVPRRKVRASEFIDFEAEEGEESDYEEEEEAEEEEESVSDEDSEVDISEEYPRKLAKMFLNDEAEDEDELKRKKRKRILIIESDAESEEDGNSSEKTPIIDSCINKTVSCERSTPEEMMITETSVNESIRSKSNEDMSIENDDLKNVQDCRGDLYQEGDDKIKEVRPEVSISASILSNIVDKEAHPLPIHCSSDEKSLAETIATLKNALQIVSSEKIENESSEINLDNTKFVCKEVNQDNVSSEEEINKLEIQEQHPKVKSNLIKIGNNVKNPVVKNKTKIKTSPQSLQKTKLMRRNREIERRATTWNIKEVNNADSLRKCFETKDSAFRIGCMEQTLGDWNVTENKVIEVDGWTVQEQKMSREKLRKDIASKWFITNSFCDRDGPWIVRDNVHTHSKGKYKILLKNFPHDWSGNVSSLFQINSGDLSVERFGSTCFLLCMKRKSVMQKILFSGPCILKMGSNSQLLTCETYPVWTVYVSGVPFSLSQERVKKDLLSIMDKGDVYDVFIPKNSLDNRNVGHAILKVINKEARNRILNSQYITLWGKVLMFYNEEKFLKKYVLKISNWNFPLSRCDAVDELKNLITSWGVKQFLVVCIGNFIGLKFFQGSCTKKVLQKSNVCILGEEIYFRTWDLVKYECPVENLII